MTTEKRKRRQYTEEFKREAVALVTEHGYKPSEAARSLSIGNDLVRRWKRELEEEASANRPEGIQNHLSRNFNADMPNTK
jgi:transposase